MRIHRSLTLAAAGIVALAPGVTWGQTAYTPVSASYSQLFSAEELDNLVAPIALYPDPILAQALVAATFEDQIDIASRHVKMFGTDAIDYQPWDVSVKSVAHYPPVLNMLAERTDWATALGQAYAYQPEDLMDAVQRLRRMARYQGNLVSTPQHTVIIEREVIRIVPANPRVIYVPVYDPAIIYYRRSAIVATVHTSTWSFGIAFPIGVWLNYDCDWGVRRVYYDDWRRPGWRAASRPYVQVVNIYIQPRYEVVNVNRTIIYHTVNHVELEKNNTVHGKVTFKGYRERVVQVADAEDGRGRGGSGGGPERGGNGGGNSGNGGSGGNSGSNGNSGGNAGGGGAGGRGGGRGGNVQAESRSLPQQQSAPTQPAPRVATPRGAQPAQRPAPQTVERPTPQTVDRPSVPSPRREETARGATTPSADRPSPQGGRTPPSEGARPSTPREAPPVSAPAQPPQRSTPAEPTRERPSQAPPASQQPPPSRVAARPSVQQERPQAQSAQRSTPAAAPQSQAEETAPTVQRPGTRQAKPR